MFLGLFEFSVLAAMPVQTNPIPKDAQPIPAAQVTSCTVPTGLSEDCTRALENDCQQIRQCNGDADCMTNRPRVDASACEEKANTPQRQTFLETDDNPLNKVRSPVDPSAAPKKQPASSPSPASTPVRTAGGTSSDPSSDVRSCLRALSSAQSACNIRQADSFDSQLSGGTNGFGGANIATAGIQNVNNIVLNCSNSQSICASTCGDSWSSWQSQCGDDCTSSVASAVSQLQDAKSSCDGLSSNLQYLSSAANDSLNTASQQMGDPGSLTNSQANQNPSAQGNQMQMASIQAQGGDCSYQGNCNVAQGSVQSAHAGFIQPSSTNASNFYLPETDQSNGDYQGIHQRLDSSGAQPHISPVPNGGGAFPAQMAGAESNGQLNQQVAKQANLQDSNVADIERGFLSGGGYSSSNGTSPGNSGFGNAPYRAPSSNSQSKWVGFPLGSYLNQYIAGKFNKFINWLGISDSKEEITSAQPERLGNDGELAMGTMPSPHKSSGNGAYWFDAIVAAVVGSLCWLFFRERKLEQIAKAEFDRRQSDRRIANDRRTSPTVPREAGLERRSSEKDRRTHEQRVEERRTQAADRRSEDDEVTVISFEKDRRKALREDRRVGSFDYRNATVVVGRR